MSKAAEKFLASNTLSFVVSLSIGKVTTVELRNETYVTGRVTEVDGFMNVTLRDVEFVDAAKNRKKFSHFFVPCRLIRYVQIPTEIDIKEAIHKRFDPEFQAKTTAGRGREFKIGGAQKKILAMREKRRQEDLASALKMKNKMAGKS